MCKDNYAAVVRVFAPSMLRFGSTDIRMIRMYVVIYLWTRLHSQAQNALTLPISGIIILTYQKEVRWQRAGLRARRRRCVSMGV